MMRSVSQRFNPIWVNWLFAVASLVFEEFNFHMFVFLESEKQFVTTKLFWGIIYRCVLLNQS